VKKQPKNNDVVVEQVRLLCRSLKMPGLARRLDELVRLADSESWSCLDILDDALSTEVSSRDASSVRLRIREARFPDLLTLDNFDFSLANGVDKKQVLELARGGFVDDKQNIVFLGPVGTGKTHLATALGIEMARRRQRVTWFRAADLVSTLIEAKGARELGRLHRRLARSKVLVLDELGFVPFDREGGELLFNLLSSRHRMASTIITSNLAFSEWPKVFGGDEKLTAAVLDRLAENAVVVVTKGASYRARRRDRAGATPG
jgi:DNA replication protein DnaC